MLLKIVINYEFMNHKVWIEYQQKKATTKIKSKCIEFGQVREDKPFL